VITAEVWHMLGILDRLFFYQCACCDKTVPFGSFALVIDTMRQSGIQNISVVTEPLEDTPH